jgi:hypothetical protein
MKLPSRRPRPSAQLNLPLLNVPASVVPDDKQVELVLALVELLVSAANEHRLSEGGGNERQAHR